MATTVTFNGVNYSIPAVNEEDWQSLSNYLIALQNAAVAGGPVRQNIRVSTSSTTAVATTDYVVLINYAGAATVNLPAGVDEQVFVIADASGNASTNNITINRNGFNNILGGASYVLDKDNQSIILGFHAGQGNWYRIAESIPGAIEGPASSVVGGLAAFANTTGDSLQDLGVGSANQVLVTDGTTPSFALIANANVSGSAAIAYSKLALTNSIVNADISSGAAIAYSKLTLTGSIVNADINASAAIAYSKLNLTASITNSDIFGLAGIDYSKLNLSGSIVNADVNASAAIAYSKLNLTGSIVNADVNASAAIAYSKLTLTGSIVDADINASAAIARSKIASGSASHVVVNDGAGALSSVATLPVSQGGTGLNALGSALQVLRVDSLGTSLEFATLAAGSGDVIGPASSVTNGIVQFASTTGKALKDLGVGSANQVLLTNGTAPSFGQITNAYIDATAAIDFSKMAALTASRALETDGSGFIVASAVTSTELGYVSGVTSAIQTQIDGKLPLTGGTLTGALTITPTTNQLVLGTTNTTTISATAPAASRVYTIPDAGGAADFVLTAGAQTIAGAKTFSDDLTVGSNALFVDVSTGNVGIGTPSPNFALDIAPSAGSLRVASSATGDTIPFVTLDGIDSGEEFVLSNRTSDNTFRISYNPISYTGSEFAASSLLSVTSAGAVTLGPAVTNNFNGQVHTINGGFRSGNVTATDQSGFLFIGNNVRGGTTTVEALRTNATSGGAGLSLGNRTSNTVEAISFWVNQAGDSTSTNADLIMWANQNGAWTLGPSSGSTLIHTLQSGADTQVQIKSVGGANVPYLQFYRGATYDAAVAVGSSANQILTGAGGGDLNLVVLGSSRSINFSTDAVNIHGRIGSTGAWTLGPSGGLNGFHTIQAASNNANEGALSVKNTNATDANPVARFETAASGSTVANKIVNFLRGGLQSGAIVVNGTGAATFGTYSDSRLKTNIVPLSNELANILALNPVSFDMLDGAGSTIGFIAQEMETVYPDAVSYVGPETEEMKFIGGWDKTSARLVKAIQELHAELQTLKGA